jgi:hypothetical protein
MEILQEPVSVHETLLVPSVQAGLLTFLPFRRPSRSMNDQWHIKPCGFLCNNKDKDYSGGPVPDFHGIPFGKTPMAFFPTHFEHLNSETHP